MRNTSKLRNLLISHHSLLESLIDSNLTIVEGNAKDRQAVSKALVITDKDGRSELVDIILSGVGGVPVFTPNPLRPTLDDPTICQDATRTILAALNDHISHTRHNNDQSSPSSTNVTEAKAKKPLLIVVSTTGISPQGRDLPLLMIPLYHWMLPVPHADKREMEKLLIAALSDPTTSPISGFVCIRPSLLTDGKMLGLDQIRAGWEVETEAKGSTDKSQMPGKPAVGYTISRADVGNWIYRRLVAGEKDRVETDWVGKMVSLTA